MVDSSGRSPTLLQSLQSPNWPTTWNWTVSHSTPVAMDTNLAYQCFSMGMVLEKEHISPCIFESCMESMTICWNGHSDYPSRFVSSTSAQSLRSDPTLWRVLSQILHGSTFRSPQITWKQWGLGTQGLFRRRHWRVVVMYGMMQSLWKSQWTVQSSSCHDHYPHNKHTRWDGRVEWDFLLTGTGLYVTNQLCSIFLHSLSRMSLFIFIIIYMMANYLCVTGDADCLWVECNMNIITNQHIRCKLFCKNQHHNASKPVCGCKQFL